MTSSKHDMLTGPSWFSGKSVQGNGFKPRLEDGRTAPPDMSEPFGLSAAQRGIWFAQHLAGASPISVAQYVDIDGDVNTDLLVKACKTAAREFGSGHLRLTVVDGEPRQFVDPDGGPPVSAMDLCGVGDPVATAHGLMVEDYSAPLDLLRDPLMRSVIFQVGPRHFLWYLRAHHIALDGYAGVTMVHRITELYNAWLHGEDAPPSTAEDLRGIVEQDLAYPGSERFDNDRRYWMEHLADAPAAVSLAGRVGKPTIHPALVSEPLPDETAELLDRVAVERRSNATPIIVAAFAAYLGRMAGSDEVLLSLPISGRHSAVLRRSGGMVANVVPLRVRVASRSVGELIAAAQSELTSALRRQRYRQEDIFHDMGIARDEAASFGPAVNLMVLDNEVALGDTIGRLNVLTSGPTADLFVNIYQGAGRDRTHIDFQGNPNVYGPAELAGHHRRFLQFLHEFLAGGTESDIARLPLVDAGERSELLPVRGPRSVGTRLLPDILTAGARRNGAATAIVSADATVTYGELDTSSSRLARRLVALGCGPDTTVAIVLRRSVESVTAAWAVAKSGAAIVHVDPEYPPSRIEHILTDSAVTAVVTVEAHRSQLPAATRLLVLDDAETRREWEDASGLPISDDDRIRPLRLSNLAYITYTSGSTGLPKGVLVTHAGLANLVADRSSAYGIDANSRVSYALSPSFDASLEQFLTCFANGSTLVVVPPEVIGGDPLTRLLADRRVTHLTLTPTMLATVDPHALPEVRVVVVGGDVCPPHVVGRWTPTASVYNEYGPTETTVTATYTAMDPEHASNVGSPIRGVAAMVLDRTLQPAPKGTPGELYLTGPGLARGYNGRFGETAARFVADPHSGAGGRMYRTGDIARWTDDGSHLTLELAGRSDFQIKIRGYRIEPGEIDASLSLHEDVDQSVTVPVQNNAGTTVLATYVVPVDGHHVNRPELEHFARESLPPHMVPAVIQELGSLPVNAFGKLDRKALPEPDFAGAASSRPPVTPGEILLAGLFADVLGVPEVGAEDSFFALGGDSILSIQLVARAKAGGLSFSTQDVFEHKTVAGLAAVATEVEDVTVLAELPGGGVGPMPLSPIARAMLDRGHVDRFAQAMLIRLPEGVDRAGLVRALRHLLDRHDMLRAALRGDAADGFVEVLDGAAVDADAALAEVRLERRDAAEVDGQLQAAADRLDPGSGALLRAVWMRDEAGRGPDLMWLVIHHLAVDAVSWRILLPDLAQGWQGEFADDVQPGTTSVRRWTHGLVEQAAARRAAELDGWKTVLESGDRLLGSRGLDPSRDVAATAGRIRRRVPAEVTEAALTTIPARFHGNANDPLLAALALALGQWRRRRGLPVDGELISLEGHGREEQAVPGADLSATVGWFTTRFPVRIDLRDIDFDDAFAGGPAAGAALKRVKEQLRAMPDNGIGYGMLRRLDPVGVAELGDLPEPQISVNYLGRAGTGELTGPWTPATEFTALTATSDPRMALPAVLDINMIAEPGTDGLELDATWDFASEVLASEDVDELAELWVRALRGLAEHVRSAAAGGFTPSDFPLAAVTQEDIDRWLPDYPSMTEVWPLTALQSGLLFHAVYDRGGDDGYIVQAMLTLAGQLDGSRMRRAAQALVERHDSLRTAFVDSADGPRQIVLGDARIEWHDADLTDIADADERARALRELATAASGPFDPTRPPLLRFHLIRTGTDEFRLLVTNHHIVLDGWSTPLLIHDLLSLYIADGQPSSLAHPRSYREYLRWLHTRDRDAAFAAWRQTLAGIDGPTRIAGVPDRAVPADNDDVALNLDAATTAAVLDLGRAHGVTPNTAVQVAWALLLSARTGRSDIVFGNTVSDRPPQIPDVERMVGLFINTVPVRIRLDPRETIADLLVRVQDEQAATVDHRHVGLAELQRATGIADMFDTVTVLESYPLDRQQLARTIGDAGLRLVAIDAQDATPYPLSLQVTPPRPTPDDTEPGSYAVALRFSRDRFGADEARTLLEAFELVLGRIVTDPAATVAAIAPYRDSERAELLSVRGREITAELTLREILSATARQHPDAAAVRFGSTAWTYRELDARADRFARLLTARGACPESFVAVAVPRSAELVLAIWAVAKTGAACVMVDPGNPAARIAELLADSRADLGVTVDAVAERLPDDVEWLRPDDPDEPDGSALSSAAPEPLVDSAAYVIYTSGSTGKPKPVQVSHRGLAGFVSAQADAFGVRRDSVVLQVASPGFDACLAEVLLAHAAGACLAVAPPEVFAGDDLEDVVRTERISHAILTPSVLNTLDPSRTPSLTCVAVVGEATGPDTVRRWGPGRRLLNQYGPTECTIWATGTDALGADESADIEPITIGGPIDGVSVAVLDMWLRPVPVGVAGELYIGGRGLARGYFGRPGVTASRFVADPNSPSGERLYRTGDSVRWVRGRIGLELEYLGRNDLQVKIHGVRIETGDIDAHLSRNPAVAGVTTIARQGSSGESVLVSYVVPAPGVALDVAALHDDLAAALPSYMNPAAIVELDRMPLTAVGKVDRNALRERAFEPESGHGRPPATDAERAMARLFGDVLHLDEVSAESNFFALGGDSIVSMRLVALARSAGFALTPRDVFERKTVAALAALAADSPGADTDDGGPGLAAARSADQGASGLQDFLLVELTRVDVDRLRRQYPALLDVWPLSPMQSGIYFHSTFNPDAGDNYTVQTVIELGGAVDGERMRRAAQAVVDRHDTLRAAFVETAAGPCQVVLSHADVEFTEIDLTDSEPQRRVDVDVIAAADVAAGFDLSAPPLVRFTLVRVGPRAFRLLVTNHHAILDGWSMPLLMRELLDYYGAPAQIGGGEPAPSYRDYLAWLRRQDMAASKDAWAHAYSDFEAPTRVSRGMVVANAASASVAEIETELTGREYEQLRAAVADAAVTVNAALAAAWALNLRVLSGETDVVFGSAVSGRPAELPLVEQTLGMFLNTIPLRVRLEPAMTVRQLLIRIQERHAALLEHHYIGLPEILRSIGVPELFDTALAFQSFPVDRSALQGLVDAAGLEVGKLAGVDATPYPLSLVVAPTHAAAPGLRITLRFFEREFAPAHARSILDRFAGSLRRLAGNPELRLAELSTPMEPRFLRPIPAAGPAVPVTLAGILAASAAAGPDAVAVSCGAESLTYRQLDERSARLARLLLRQGAGPGTVVASAFPRSVHAVATIWAAAKAGAAFLPVDPNLPADRIEFLLSDSRATLGLTDTASAARLPASLDWLVVDDDRSLRELNSLPATPITDAERGGPIRPQQPAYLVYTSGSTGLPKGVLVSHRGLAAVVAAQRSMLRVGRRSAVVQLAAPGFDASVFELLLAHGSGGRLVVSPPDVYGGPELAELIRREHVSHAVVTPSALSTVPPDGLDGLRVLATAGEPVGPELVERWASGRTMVNLYGPSESTIWATGSDPLVPGDAITIGRPVGPVAAAVLDTWLRPASDSVAGELYLFGPGLADGYIDRPGLTACRFVACPFGEPGQRMYRTGDAVRRNADGELEFLGRNDFQVKIRGARIELGEIDAVLGARPDVAFATTVPWDLDGRGAVLVSYVVPAADTRVSAEELAAALAAALPAYMVPSAVMLLDEVPLTANGKLDRERLPRPMAGPRQYRAPSSPVETVVALAFEDVLGLDRVGADDDFFALGGDSLSASLVVARVGAAVAARVPVRLVFEQPTVRGLAEVVGSLGRGDRVPLTAAERRPETVPLSLAQQRMWFLNRFEPGSAAYNIPVMLRLSGRLDADALAGALRDVAQRHEVLRTIYPDTVGDPRQVILDEPGVALESVRIADDAVTDAVTEFVCGGFDLTTQEPMRARLFEVGAPADATSGEFLLVLVVHHIASDGQSMGPLARDVMAAYTARLAAEPPQWQPLPVQYADFALWQRHMLGAADDPTSLMSTQLAFWRATLAGAPERLDLPADRVRPPVASLAGGRVPVDIDADLHRRLLDLARSRGSSLFMVMHAALAVVLGRLSGSDDVVIGTPVAGRSEPGLDDLVGMFVNTLALRTPLRLGEPFAELVTRIRDTDLRAFEHADVPFERVVEELNPERSAAQHPLFQVALAFQNLSAVEVALPDVVVTRANVDTGLSLFDLQLMLSDSYDESGAPQGISGVMRFARDLFDEATAAGFARKLLRVLDVVAADSAAAVGDINWLDGDERAALTSRVGPRADRDGHLVLPELFAAAVRANPDGAAVVAGDVTLTYAELDERSNRLARLLIHHGAGPETTVLVAAERSVESLVAWWAVVKSGAAYVPVDPRYPARRIERMVADSGALLGVTVTRARAALPGSADWIVLDDTAVAARIAALPGGPVGDEERLRPLHPAHTAWVVFTSGSTGVPKGVAVTHSGIADFVAALRADGELGPTSRVLHFASLSFDASLLEILIAVSGAAALVVAPTDVYGGDELAELLRSQRITHAFVTPAALASVDPAGLDDVRVVMSGGDTVPADLVSRWVAADSLGTRQFRVLYGPTESTIVATATASPRPGERPTIGVPTPGTQALVLDSRLHPVPAGVGGELYLAGPALARGYVNQAATSASRFVAHPFGTAGTRAYRTGDLVRWNPDGDLEFLGRSDFQVKVRGYRIELGEIDAVLGARADVVFAATVAHADGPGPTTLVSYVVPAAGASVTGPELISAVAAALPSYMVPATVLILDRIPLSPNGKLDRAALPAPVLHTRRFRAPASPAEEIVAGVFADVLGIDGAVGADDDFFELGGNSLLATRALARIGAALDANVPVSTVFEAPTVAKLAARAAARAATGREPLTPQPHSEHAPLSYAQQRMWFLNRVEPGSGAYNIPIAIRLTGRLDVDALRRAIADVVTRHEVLRTVYPQVAGEPSQVVRPIEDAVPSMAVVPVAESELSEAVSAFLSEAFDLVAEVPFRIRLFEVGPREWVLALGMHHISGDGSSLGPLARDTVQAYVARARGDVPAWSPPAVQYADYAIWQRRVLGGELDSRSPMRAQIDYWTTQLADLPALLELPSDRPRPPAQSHGGANVPIAVDADLHAALRRVARAHNATLFMVFHAALAATLARLANTDDIAIGTPYGGRGEPELDDLIGMFVNTLVLRTRLTGGMSFAQLLEHVRATDLAAFEHADVPFEILVQELNPMRSQSHSPLFQVMLAFQEPTATEFELPGLSASAVESDADISLFDLHVSLSESYDSAGAPAGVAGGMIYATDLFDPPTVQMIAEALMRTLAALAADSAGMVHEVSLVDGAAVEAASSPWDGTEQVSSGDETLASAFVESVGLYSDRPAVAFEDQSLTYAEFAARVFRLARWLISQGVGPESLVALPMPRSLDQITAMYAVHAAGGGYVPVDPDQPAARVEYMLEVAAPVLVLSSLDGLDVSNFDDRPVTDDDRLAPLRPHNVAYVLFTSGSTGRPKGVAVSHGSVLNQLRWLLGAYRVSSDDVVLQKTPATFDVSVWELFGTLIVGAQLVIARPGGHADPAYLAETVAARQVTAVSFVPSMLALFADTAPAELLGSLRTVLVGGEAFGMDTVVAARRVLPHVELHNLYGPTEFTVHATAHRVDATVDRSVPIGAPVLNARAYVLDSRLRPVPPGVVGELYLAGIQVARGYHARPGLTAERFVPDPHVHGQRAYRTGDLVRRRRTGELEYLGRNDFQVKLRGLRIELGEIEAMLAEHPTVALAAAVVHTAGNADQLVGYLVPAEGATVDTAAVLAHVAGALPDYMVPTAVVELDEMPLTASGKLDRARLPKPAPAQEFREPASWLEQEIARVFGQVLGLDRVGADDDFYALGGNSLKSVQVVGELKKELGIQIPAAWMSSRPSPADLAKRIEAGIPVSDPAATGFEVVLPIRGAGRKPPLFCIHPASGLAWCYRPLDEYLSADRPIYGIQAPQIGGEVPGPTSIDDIARRYAAEIRAIQPHGPYHLLGWSLGGVIAHAVAVELRAAGEQVGLLALLDAEADGVDAAAVSDVTAGELVSNLGRVVGIDFVRSDATAEEAAALIEERLGSGLGVDAHVIERMTEAYNSSIRAVGDWSPRVLDGDMLFFTATRERRADATGHHGWAAVVRGPVSNVDVDVTHLAMTEPDAIARVAEELNARLDES